MYIYTNMILVYLMVFTVDSCLVFKYYFPTDKKKTRKNQAPIGVHTFQT